MPSGAATMQTMRMSRAPAPHSRSSAATALPPVASIGSIMSTKLAPRPGGSFAVVLRRDGRQLVALQTDVADPGARAPARAPRRACRGRRGAPARRRCRADAAAGGRTERRVDRDRPCSARSRSASAASSTLMRVAARRNCSGSVRLSRRSTSASCTSGWSTVDRHGSPLYNFSSMRAHRVRVRDGDRGALRRRSRSRPPLGLARRDRWHRRDGECRAAGADAGRRGDRRRRHRGRRARRSRRVAATGTPRPSMPATTSCCRA